MQFPELNYPFEIKNLYLNDGRNIAYFDNEIGEQTIIFIHGLSSNISAWIKNLPQLSKKFRCVAIDLPAYGKSSHEYHNGNLEFYSGVIIEIIEKLELKNVSLAGHSMGGQISIFTALRFPEEISKLILIAPAGFENFTDQEKEIIKRNFTQEKIYVKDEKRIANSIKNNFYESNDFTAYLIEEYIKISRSKNYFDYCKIVSNSLSGLLDEPVNHKLHEVKQKTIIMYSDKDYFIPNKFMHNHLTQKDIFEIEGKKIPYPEIHCIKNSGHFLQAEKFEEVNKLIADFLR